MFLLTISSVVAFSQEMVVEVSGVVSPNGDGINDDLKFWVYQGGFAVTSLDIQFRVITMEGVNMYEYEGSLAEFQGAFVGVDSREKPMASGTYFYVLETTQEDGRRLTTSGFIYLIR